MNTEAANVMPAATSGALTQQTQVEIQRAVAELHAHMTFAASRPRDEEAVTRRVLVSCENVALAEMAVYEFVRGGSVVKGLSVKMVQNIARCWGNVVSGLKEVERGTGYSLVRAYAWDLETGYGDERLVNVRHWRDTRSGGYPLRDERDIADLIANQGQRRKRSVMETILPPELLDAAFKRCEQTVMKSADLSPEGIERLLAAFGDEFGVTREQIEARIQRHVNAMTARQFLALRKAFVSLREGMATVEELFPGGAGRAPAARADHPSRPTGRERARDAVRERVKPKEKESAPPAEPDPEQDGGDDPAAVAGGAPASSLASLRAALIAAPSLDEAALVMDRARDLPQAERDALAIVFEQRFGEPSA